MSASYVGRGFLRDIIAKKAAGAERADTFLNRIHVSDSAVELAWKAYYVDILTGIAFNLT
jgi:hypothetical protein